MSAIDRPRWHRKGLKALRDNGRFAGVLGLGVLGLAGTALVACGEEGGQRAAAPEDGPTDSRARDRDGGGPGSELRDGGIPAENRAHDDGGDAGLSVADDAATHEPAVCGDQVVDPPEQCEQGQVVLDCQALGFETGDLSCVDCRFDDSDCRGTERCFDARDNDGDRKVDCDDADCETACQSSCLAPVSLMDVAELIEGDNTGHANEIDACESAATGSEVVYQLTASHTGILELSLQTAANLSLSVRQTCGDSLSELACAYSGRLELEVVQGQDYLVVVDGADPSESGAYTISAVSREIVCGDGHRDGEEGCDDHDTDSNDGCSANCEVEASEIEPNDDLALASSWTHPFFGMIEDAADRDFIVFEVEQPATSVVASTFDYGDGACAKGELDSELALFDGNGTELSSDDDGGDHYCARVEAFGLGTGLHYVRVAASSAGAGIAFPYVLHLEFDACGNGAIGGAEQCDDGNTVAGDGCAPDCQVEP